jgi:hypothetical protein
MQQAAILPDGSECYPLVFTVTVGWSGATSTSGVIQIMPPNGNNAGGVRIAHGNSIWNPAASPTGHTDTTWNENTIGLSILGATSRFTITAAGIRVVTQSGADASDGMLFGGRSVVPLATGAGAWTTYSYVLDDYDAEAHTVTKGITTRARFDQENYTFAGPIADQYSNYYTHGTLPHVFFDGLNANGSISVSAVLHVSVRWKRVTPIPAAVSHYEPELDQIIHYVNSQDFVVSGHSFKSFIQKIGRGIGSIFRFVRDEVIPLVGPVSTAIRSVKGK